MKTNSPVFLVGAVRSGSTLLRLMLNSHPEVTNPGECDFLFDLVGDSGRYPVVTSYQRWLRSNRVFLAMHLSVDMDLAFPNLIESFINQFQRPDAVLIMNAHRHFHRIPYLFPNAKYIHLLRDPRDVARSCIGMGWVGHVYYGADIWKDAEQSWDKLKPMLGDGQYLEIKYEDILDNVEDGLAGVCEFLGLEYSGRMLDYADNSTYAKPDKNLSYQWINKYGKHELALVEGKVGKMIVDRGYALSGQSPFQPGTIEKLFLAAQNKRFRISHQIERYGFGLYMKMLMASRLGIQSWQDTCQKEKNLIDLRYLK